MTSEKDELSSMDVERMMEDKITKKIHPFLKTKKTDRKMVGRLSKKWLRCGL